MVDTNMNGDEPRLVLTGGGSGARVVLAEADAPGSLHYLLEAEGFSVVGCAGDEDELGRVLRQGVDPDVVVLDADIVATSTLVARELAPDAHVIAVWPDDVQPPPGGERVSPRMVYEELGPAIRRHMERRSVPVPLIALPADEPAMASVAGAAVTGGVFASVSTSSGMFARAASRMSVLSVTLITAILLTMGVSFALGGFRSSPGAGPPRVILPGTSDAGVAGSGDPGTGRVPTGVGSGPTGSKPPKGGSNGQSHHQSPGNLGDVVTTGSSGGTPTGQTGDQGSGQGDQGSGQGGGQGDQGGSQGDQGGGSSDQGGGSGNGGGSGDQGGGSGNGGGQGDQGGGGHHGGDGDGDQGDQGGDGQGDQGGDGQGDQGGSQGDQGDDQGDQNSQGDQGSQGNGHGAHSDQQDQNNQGNQS